MKWPWLGCSRGRPPRIVLKPRRPKAVRAFARFLTADVADGADEETAAGLSELPVLLFQALGFVMLSRIAPRVGNHGWTRIHTDELGGRVAEGVSDDPRGAPSATSHAFCDESRSGDSRRNVSRVAAAARRGSC